ncbi:MAG: hypothetical protein MJE77_45705 [Proteobacteria bacterium]|nr:hypothetical protein [Pseudomonadota bacterium]
MLAVVAALGVLVVSVPTALAGFVRGQVKFDGQFGKPPKRNQGFIARIANPIRPVKQFDPRPYLVVVLEGGPVVPGAKNPPGRAVSYSLRGEAFSTPILPVVVKTEVEIRNAGPSRSVLSTPGHPDLLDQIVLEPAASNSIKVENPFEAIIIRSPHLPHPEGRVVGFPTRYFARVDRRGRFYISNVPEGTWKMRLWYRDGWVEGVEQTVVVTRARRRPETVLRVRPNQIPKTAGN